MIVSGKPAHGGFDDCGCGEGLTAVTPLTIYNRPGLRAIAYRVGRHEDFKRSLLARLSTSMSPGLRRLTCRDDDDFTIALLDAWAVVADILTFYQERLANEAFLATAGERLSVVELARLVGYRPKPGAAAGTLLAFTLEESPGLAPGTIPSTPVQTVFTETIIDVGTQVRSVPGPDEQSQTYETMGKLVARAAWNAMKPRLWEPQVLEVASTEIFLEGTSTLLKPGDGLLLFPGGAAAPLFREVVAVIPYPEAKYSKVIVEAAGGEARGPQKVQDSASKVQAHAYRAGTATAAVAAAEKWPGPRPEIQATPPRVLAFRLRAAIFGHNAPPWASLPFSQRIGELGYSSKTEQTFLAGAYAGREASWAETTLAAYHGEASGSTTIYLDNLYPQIIENSWLVLRTGAVARPYRVASTAELSKTDFGLTAKVTGLTLDTAAGFADFTIRTTTVYAQSEELTLSRRPLTSPVSGAVIDLEGVAAGLTRGQRIILGGRPYADGPDIVYETGIIDKVEVPAGPEAFTRLTLKQALQHSYLRHTVTVNANVGFATHGEKVREILGSGDAAQVFQTFPLRHAPLTYVSAAAPGGVQSTLEIRVNELLWQEVPSLFEHGPDERIYQTVTDEQGRTLVQFGDGRTGSRLPSGRENVVAVYRKGLGLAGRVRPRQLSLLMNQPLGVKGVTNPFAAEGADDPESLEDAREHAPLTVRTLERVVSLKDYEDYARTFAGIAKALAVWFWNGRERIILLTVAAPQGASVAPGSQVHDHLVSALRLAGEPHLPFRVASYRPRTFALAARIKVDPAFLPDKVIKEVQEALRVHFSFEARQFGQAVALSEVMGVIQQVRGVQAADVDALRYSEAAPGPRPETLLTASLPELGGGGAILAAELLTLEPAPAAIGVMP
jgi:predicted phage baseplate assembly protein